MTGTKPPNRGVLTPRSEQESLRRGLYRSAARLKAAQEAVDFSRLRFGTGFSGFGAALCCGGAFATRAAARSNASHASDRNSISGTCSTGALVVPTHQPSDIVGSVLQKIADEPYERYWAALGKFIHAFSLAEGRLISFLKTEAKVSNEIGGVLFHGTRIEAAKELLNNILTMTGQTEKKKRLETPINQLSAIATVRNNIIHWGARHDGREDLLVSNTDKYPIRPKEFRISPADLERMYSDLNKINVWLLVEQHPTTSDQDVWSVFFAQPWLYTPPQPSPPKNQRRRAQE
jgi:hypothetical protein